MRKHTQNKNAGFTLGELLYCLAIFAVLASVVWAGFGVVHFVKTRFPAKTVVNYVYLETEDGALIPIYGNSDKPLPKVGIQNEDGSFRVGKVLTPNELEHRYK